MAGPGSSLLLSEYFEAEDPRFLDELFALTAQKKLKAFAARWVKDTRPFARLALFRYIDDGCDRPGHRVLVKTLFKSVEAAGDDEAMGRFMVAFDRLLRRTIRVSPAARGSASGIPVLRKPEEIPVHANIDTRVAPEEAPRVRFSMRTRAYLCRRAFRYFRRIGQRDPARYARAARAALVLYDDRHLQKPEQLVDAWGLIHMVYWGSPAISRSATGAHVARGHTLAELEPAPIFPDAWKGAFDDVFEMLSRARSRVVRTFAIAMLELHYPEPLKGLPVARVLALFRSRHDEVQAFAAELLPSAVGVETLDVAEWLVLLSIDNPVALLFLCDLVKKHVAPGRVTLEQCVELACVRPAPVAELGLAWAQTKPVQTEAAVKTLVGLGRAEAPVVREAGVQWVVQVLERSPYARPEHLRDLLDSKHQDVRKKAIESMRKTLRFKDSTDLWAALSESPYDETRAFLVMHLKAREAKFSPETLRHIWVTALLAVHRGSRAKRAAVDQVADRIVQSPAEAESLLPLLAIALRSAREPERRAALAAIARAAYSEPVLRHAIARKLPELKLFDESPS